ncbi:MAG: glycogen synthase, partial [Thermoproteota archaeon]|nr:glycogen synthase [Thermoproteota archaeon]
FDPEDIAWGLNCGLADPDITKKLGENARKRVIEYYTWEKAAKNTLEVYKEVLSNNRTKVK